MNLERPAAFFLQCSPRSGGGLAQSSPRGRRRSAFAEQVTADQARAAAAVGKKPQDALWFNAFK